MAALGFEQLLFVRAAQAAPAVLPAAGPQRLADGWLSQLAWMVPHANSRYVRCASAELAVELAWRLPHAAPATRVLAPELLWQAAYSEDGGEWLAPGWRVSRAAGDVPRPRW